LESLKDNNDLIEVFTNPTKEKIENYEALLAKREQVDLQVLQTAFEGVYTRTIFIPAGVSLVGAVWNKDHTNIMCGDITVTTDEGMKRLVGYNVFCTKAGMKRVGYAHCPTYWTSVVHTNETDITKIEDEITLESNKLQTRRIGITSKVVGLLEGE
jgi:hypothetical protein